MIKELIGSRKWTIGTLYVGGVILCDILKAPLSPDALTWTGIVITTLIGGQHVQESIAKKGQPNG